jgi:quercetin dioxygenase-like cupin family protein
MKTEAQIVRPGDIAPFSVVGDSVMPLMVGGDLEIFELTGAENSGPPLHSHPWEESYVILDGQIEVQLDHTRCDLGPGAAVRVPGDTPHAYRVSSKTARFLVITSPDGAGSFFREVDANVKELPRDLDVLFSVAARHQVAVHGPSLVETYA